MQSQLQQKQQHNLQPSQQSVMQPTMMQTSSLSTVVQNQQPLALTVDEPSTFSFKATKTAAVIPTHQNPMGQQTNATNMQPNQLIGQQNSYSELQQQQVDRPANKLSGLQQPQ